MTHDFDEEARILADDGSGHNVTSERVVRHPDVCVQLTKQDSNIFSITGRVSTALRRAGYQADIPQFTDELFASQSYDEALACVMRWVSVS